MKCNKEEVHNISWVSSKISLRFVPVLPTKHLPSTVPQHAPSSHNNDRRLQYTFSCALPRFELHYERFFIDLCARRSDAPGCV